MFPAQENNRNLQIALALPGLEGAEFLSRRAAENATAWQFLALNLRTHQPAPSPTGHSFRPVPPTPDDRHQPEPPGTVRLMADQV